MACSPDASVGGTCPAADARVGVVVPCLSDVSALLARLYLPDVEPVDEESPAAVPEPCQVGLYRM
jgi:hypothetical protein